MGFHAKRVFNIALLVVAMNAGVACGSESIIPAPTTQPAATPPISISTPAVSQYRQQALEQVATIGQKEPELANMLANQVAAMDEDGVARLIGFKKLAPIQKAIDEGNYTIDSLIDGTNETFIVAVSRDDYRRKSMLPIFKAAIPAIEQVLGINYRRPLLMIDLDNSTSAGGGGGINIKATDWILSTMTHEAGHEVWEVYPFNLGIQAFSVPLSTPRWLQEGVAGFAGTYAESKLPETVPDLTAMMASPEWKGKEKKIWDLETAYQAALTLLPGEDPNQPLKLGPMPKGRLFLYEFFTLVGQDTFAKAMGHLYSVEVARADLIRKDDLPTTNPAWTLTDKDIESVLEQQVPADKLQQFKQIYQTRIYDVKAIE